MTLVSSRAPRPAVQIARPAVSAISLIFLLSVLTVVLFIAVRGPLKDDIAWLLYVARRWMAGRELYIDVVEVNPPLIIWISAIPLGLARWLGVGAGSAAMPFFAALVLGCAWWTAMLLRERGGIFATWMPVFAAIGAVLLILPAADLGQREHLLTAAFLPYLVLFARSLDRPPHRAVSLSSVATLLFAGVLAGLGCALKPRYAAVFAVLECLALTRGLRPWRIMPLSAFAALAVYAGLVAIVCPAYLRNAVPMALALYGATDVPFLTLLSDSTLLLSGLAATSGLLWLRRHRLREDSLMAVLATFAAAATVVCFLDGKDWYYHRLPATIATVLALLAWIAAEPMPWRRWSQWPSAVACLAVAVFVASSIQRLEPEAAGAVMPRQTAVDRLEQIIHAEHARTYVAFSEWIALGFPVVNETGVTWASRFDSMWALKGEAWRAGFDPSATREWPVARWVTHDFIAGCPDIAVVDTRETMKYIDVLSAADPAFARVWSRYRPIVSFDGLVVYRRRSAGCLDSWAAAKDRPAIATR